MYENFYKLKEKPFTLLPDPGFLYMSDKHRMALTLLEYGLTNHAGFTVISGEIGAGKTTLIRHLLNNMDQEYSVGLISNTHRSFGELLQWILLAFNLEHKDMSKVEMHQRFVNFIIDEYAHNRRTVLIVDEAQNMDAETLEELRMLSNINADKDQALQVVLCGQRELRETLRRPELVQFAQRITVDYHLEPLSESETAGYIRHRMKVAGGDPDTFTAKACAAIYRYSNGVPRLINLLCDTALVYGYAEQKHRIDVNLVTEVAREKQQGGIFPVYEEAALREEDIEEAAEPAAATPPRVSEPTPVIDNSSTAEVPTSAAVYSTPPIEAAATEQEAPPIQPAPAEPAAIQTASYTSRRPAMQTPAEIAAEQRWKHGQPKKKLRIVICSARENLRAYLARLLESYGLDVGAVVSPDADEIARLDPGRFDVLLVDREEDDISQAASISDAISSWPGTVLYNDSVATEVSLQKGDPEFGMMLARRITALTGASTSRPPINTINQ
jgi:type II secretory pathway predicted ATPase ExeA